MPPNAGHNRAVQSVDHDWNHLYPLFRSRLRAAFNQCQKHGLIMCLFEGHRSEERQHWLYAQGRPHVAGYHPGEIVTGLQFPKRHGCGCAADCYPVRGGKMVFEFTTKELKIWRQAMIDNGLRPTTFAGDYGHVELNEPDNTYRKAWHWKNNGFKEDEPEG